MKPYHFKPVSLWCPEKSFQKNLLRFGNPGHFLAILGTFGRFGHYCTFFGHLWGHCYLPQIDPPPKYQCCLDFRRTAVGMKYLFLNFVPNIKKFVAQGVIRE